MNKRKNKLRILKNVNLKQFSTFQIGGKAKYFAHVKSPEQFLAAIQYAMENNLSFRVFAGGSNVVFGDGTLNHLFIRFFGGKIKIFKNSFLVDGGVSLSSVVGLAVKKGLKGLEYLAGIPGTVGGAVVGNAGAYGHSISEVVQKVEVWDGKKRFWINKKDCGFSYRESIFKSKSYFILRIKLAFKKSSPKEIKDVYNNILSLRKKKYPHSLKCAGSFFKNPFFKDFPLNTKSCIDKSKIIDGKVPAGYLLEKVGVKGKVFSRIKVADFHANVLINLGNATYTEVCKVSKFLKQKVKKKFGILLEEEVQYIQ